MLRPSRRFGALIIRGCGARGTGIYEHAASRYLVRPNAAMPYPRKAEAASFSRFLASAGARSHPLKAANRQEPERASARDLESRRRNFDANGASSLSFFETRETR